MLATCLTILFVVAVVSSVLSAIALYAACVAGKRVGVTE